MTKLTKDFMRDIIAGKGFGVAPAAVEEMARTVLTGMEQEPVAYITYKGYLLHAGDPKVAEYSEPTPLYDAAKPLTSGERRELQEYRKTAGEIRRFELDMSDCDSCGQDCGADMVEDVDGEYVLLEEVIPYLYQHAEYAPQPAPAVEAVPEKLSRELFEKWCPVNIERNKWHPEYYAHYPATQQWNAWEACRAAMQQPVCNRDELTGWIKCSERMPEDSQWCAVNTDYGYYVQCWSEGQGWLGDEVSIPNYDVTHWMPLPAAPQQETKQ
ncbi:DUF551 domain-containing protein [Scandinavium goeteborgense]|uniref:Uncharacterized protein DUF551 n=1 Tax=Scandinavium goeteborgense TaxID=1851514 RepID=A0A4R6ENJ2_SCAGO|nr:DUF551 domain-containing protein [Scandinavium goeteborgense]TDN60781.1 uncharacterized protein DUF551 [Scandinavium goeteborgense]